VTPGVLSAGHGALHLVLSTDTAARMLALLLVLKTIAAAISIGSGFRGGLFFASLLLGALVGKLFALGANLDGVTGRPLGLGGGVVAPQSDGVGSGSGRKPAPCIIEGRPWSIMPGSTSRWN
jgi:H+/Cl- antiporter ClcA